MQNELKTTIFSANEAEVISHINNGKKNFQSLLEVVSFSEDTLQKTVDKLLDKELIIWDEIKLQYSFDIPLDNEKIVLSGNVMLPITIIKKKDCLLVNRGAWYKLPPDFDFRRIVWNVELPNNKRSTLIDLIKDSVLKEKKYKIEQVEEYKPLQGKLVPYNDNLKLKLNVIGSEICDITIMFIHKIGDTNLQVDFRDLKVKSTIRTADLVNQLEKETGSRNFEEIEINNIFTIDDFIFNGNSLPIREYEQGDRTIMEYMEIKYYKSKLILTTNSIDSFGNTKRLNTEEFQDIIEGVNYVKELFSNSLTEKILNKSNIFIDQN